ncbi:WecB/TagA/CpsF family glycosyltransferase [Rhizobium sullae]|nr:WecB/TagA/CpsF family glycosyltransferase [Rhizobium sullae]
MASLFRRRNTLVHIDGMPIVWLLKLQGVAATADNRLTYLDWAMEALAMSGKNGWKVGYIGSTPDICRAGIAHFVSKVPNLDIKGWDGYFDMDDQTANSKLNWLLEGVNSFGPDLLIIGMGMPRQEAFLEQYSHRLKYKVAICSGAFVEYFTGGQVMPPRLIGKIGLEWFYRLICDPKRYARRYLVEPVVLLYLIARTCWQPPRGR